jgi:hypothetical protein
MQYAETNAADDADDIDDSIHVYDAEEAANAVT